MAFTKAMRQMPPGFVPAPLVIDGKVDPRITPVGDGDDELP